MIYNFREETKKKIVKRYKELGSESFVYTEFARKYRGLQLWQIQEIIDESKKEENKIQKVWCNREPKGSFKSRKIEIVFQYNACVGSKYLHDINAMRVGLKQYYSKKK